MNKDLIKYGLLAVGAYLIYRYIQDHGGLDGLFGSVPTGYHPPVGTTSTTPVPTTYTPTPTPTPVYTPPAPTPTFAPPALDMTGLIVTPDVNDSLSGTVKINGVPTRLSIITADGRIFNTAGQEVTYSLQTSGVDINALRMAFQTAPQGIAGLGNMYRPTWLM